MLINMCNSIQMDNITRFLQGARQVTIHIHHGIEGTISCINSKANTQSKSGEPLINSFVNVAWAE